MEQQYDGKYIIDPRIKSNLKISVFTCFKNGEHSKMNVGFYEKCCNDILKPSLYVYMYIAIYTQLHTFTGSCRDGPSPSFVQNYNPY